MDDMSKIENSDIEMDNLALTIQDMNTATVVWCVYEY